jgi:hypothetical protein
MTGLNFVFGSQKVIIRETWYRKNKTCMSDGWWLLFGVLVRVAYSYVLEQKEKLGVAAVSDE